MSLTTPRASSQRLTDAAWVLGLGLGTWGVWHFLVSRIPRHAALEVADAFIAFVPAYAYEATRLRELALPMWNPYQGTGIPFLATLICGALYPARLLLLVTDVPTALALSTLGHLGLLVIGTFALGRALGARPAGAAAGACVFAVACGRPMLFVPSWLEPIAWLPIAALAAQRLITTGLWRWVVVLGISAAMPVLAGGYQVSVYFAYGLAVFILALLCDRERRGVRTLGPILGQLALAGMLAAALAAPQLLPTLAWSREAVRQTGQLSDAQISPLAFTPWTQVFLDKLRQVTVPGALLAVVGFVGSGRFGGVLGLAAAVGYMVSLGPTAPGFGLYHLIPGFGMFRGPGRVFTTLVAFLFAIGAALGLTRLGALRPLRHGRRRPMLEGTGLALALLFILPRMRNDAVLPWTSTTSLFLTGPPGMFDTLRESATRVALFGYAGDWSVNPRHGMIHQVRVLTDYDPLVSRRLRDYIRALQGLTIDDDWALPFTGGIFPKERLPRPGLLDLAAVSHVVLAKGAPVIDRTATAEWIGDFAVYQLIRNRAALPRAYVIDRAHVVPDARAALDAIVAPTFDGHREAVLVGESKGTDTADLERAPPTPARAVRLAIDRPEQVAIEFETDHTALLVLVDAFAPGWSVRVDGVPRRVWQVNHLVRGVIVHAGEHRAEFTYRAPGFAPGVASAALATGTVVAFATLARRRRRRVVAPGQTTVDSALVSPGP